MNHFVSIHVRRNHYKLFCVCAHALLLPKKRKMDHSGNWFLDLSKTIEYVNPRPSNPRCWMEAEVGCAAGCCAGQWVTQQRLQAGQVDGASLARWLCPDQVWICVASSGRLLCVRCFFYCFNDQVNLPQPSQNQVTLSLPPKRWKKRGVKTCCIICVNHKVILRITIYLITWCGATLVLEPKPTDVTDSR